jgi:hypothetical protein
LRKDLTDLASDDVSSIKPGERQCAFIDLDDACILQDEQAFKAGICQAANNLIWQGLFVLAIPI